MTAFSIKTLILIGIFAANPQFPLGFRLIAPVLAQSELGEEEIRNLTSTIAKAPDKALEARLRLARHYSQISQPDKVIDFLRPVIDRLEVSGMRLLAKAYSEKKDHLQEVRILENLVLQVKSDYVSYTRLGEAYAQIGQEENSLKNFQKAISINERYRPAYQGLLSALDKSGKRYEYRVTLLDMIKAFGETGEALSLLCKAYYQDGFLDDARSVCQKAITKSPNTADNHVYYGLTMEAGDNMKRALAIVQQAARQYPQSEFAQYTAAKLSEDNKNPIAAYKFYRQGAAADDKAARSWLGLGRMAFESKNYKESLEAFKKACENDRSISVQDFRSAATKLKLENNYQWKEKFSAEATRCHYSSN